MEQLLPRDPLGILPEVDEDEKATQQDGALSTAALITISTVVASTLTLVILVVVMKKRRTKKAVKALAMLAARESLELGIATEYLLETFPREAQTASGASNPNFYELCEFVAIGPSGKGFGKICPRDGKVNCSIVDALETPRRGKATHFVSWCWAYSLDDVVDAIRSWTQSSNAPPSTHICLWMCFFCNNQYRILEERSATGSAELQTVFEAHLAAAGQMVVILDSFLQPHYYSRAWCLFETYVCIQQGYPRRILLPSRELEAFKETIETSGPAPIRQRIQGIDLRRAEASVKADDDVIKSMISNTCGFDTVNQVVRREILKWVLYAFEQYLSEPQAG
ncbi:rngB [Symbiodinium natans]|uniref:RngB protein n=1 Tax=Symbiodinium natans TaxID=878477 RepID=A0A812IEF9_9DINO|nr:rngB [Symbiodinium natans]